MFLYTDSSGNSKLRQNIRGLQENQYELVGELIATMVAQGGPLPHLFTEGVVSYFTSMDTGKFTCDDIQEPLQSALKAVSQEYVLNYKKMLTIIYGNFRSCRSRIN